MRKQVMGVVVCLVVLVTVVGSFAKGDGAKEKKHGHDPAAMFAKKDKDGDGKLSKEEFIGKKTDAAKEKSEAVFNKKDANGDGFLTQDELTATGKGKRHKKAEK